MKKSISPADLPVLLRQVLQGSVKFATPRIARAVVTKATRQSRLDVVRAEACGETGLTARELEVLEMVARGLPNRAVAEELFLSDQTVKRHLRKVYRKLGRGEPHRGGADRVPPRAPRRHGRAALGLIDVRRCRRGRALRRT